jgi:hypothetical protein
MKSRSALILLMAALLFPANAPAQVTVLSRATLIDGTGTPAQKDITLVMENGRIRDIGPAVKTASPAGATVLDLNGKFIVRVSSMPTATSARKLNRIAPVRALRRYHDDEHADRSRRSRSGARSAEEG